MKKMTEIPKSEMGHSATDSLPTYLYRSLSTSVPGVGHKEWADLTQEETTKQLEHLIGTVYFRLLLFWSEAEEYKTPDEVHAEMLQLVSTVIKRVDARELKEKRL